MLQGIETVLPELLSGYGMLIVYFLFCAASALLFRRLVRIPDEVFRKTLHLILLCSLFVWVYQFQTWWVSALAAVGFIVLVFPLLTLAERLEGYSALLIERKRGEIKRSLVVVFCMFAALISICWGWFGERWLVLACVFAWGFGDGAAALVGKRFGRHFLEGRLIEGRKSIEGTAAMFVVSFFTVLSILLMHDAVAWHGILPIATLAAAACAVVELYTRNGMDTLTCPFAAAAVILPLVRLWPV